jgi:hypothetical protein
MPLRESGWLGTLHEDVRDVAAAALQRGAGKEVESNEIPGHLSLSRQNRLQGKTCEATFGNLIIPEGF